MVFSESPGAISQTARLEDHKKIQFSDGLKYTLTLFAKYSREYRTVRSYMIFL